MTTLADISPHLRHGEEVLWSGPPHTPQHLADYRGWHRWVGNVFVAIAIVMGLIVWTNRAEVTSPLISVVLIGVPLAMGFGFSLGIAALMRRTRRGLFYAVTTSRVIVLDPTGPASFPITKDTPITHIPGKRGVDTVLFTAGKHVAVTRSNTQEPARTVWSAPRGLLLPAEDAADAARALQTVKAKAK